MSFLFGMMISGCSPQETTPTTPTPVKPVPPINAPASVSKQLHGLWAGGTLADGSPLIKVGATGGELVGLHGVTGAIVGGRELVGATIPLRDRDGNTIMARISDWALTELPGLPELGRYILRTADGELICGRADDQNQTPNWAFPMDRVYDLDTGLPVADSSAYTFACNGGALAQCLLEGYLPGLLRTESYSGSATPTQQRDLDTYHAACVRMVRADYCGDGTAHTYAGAAIDFADALMFNIFQQPVAEGASTGPWYREAEWTPGGAFCIEKTRVMPSDAVTLADNQNRARNPHWEYILSHCPDRIAGAAGPNNAPPHPCGAQSTFLKPNGYDLADQTLRSVLANHSPLYRD